MLEVLKEHLFEKPELYLEEMVVFLWDEFDVLVSPSSISKALRSINWCKKTARRVAKDSSSLNDHLSPQIIGNGFDPGRLAPGLGLRRLGSHSHFGHLPFSLHS